MHFYKEFMYIDVPCNQIHTYLLVILLAIDIGYGETENGGHIEET